MKQETKLQRWIPSALFGMMLACSTNISLAVGDMILNTFDTADELSAVNNDWSGGTCTWDGTQDAGGGASPGSMHVICPYTDKTNDWQEVQVGRNIPWPYIDLTPFVNIECDIKPDVTNSYPAFDGNWAALGFVIQQWAWTSLTDQQIVGNGWTHVKIPLNPAITLAHLVLDFHTMWNAYPTNTISYWVDNIKLTVPPQDPMPIAIQPATPGLEINGTAINGGNSQRQFIRTIDGSYTWVGAANPVTYSMTITSAPTATNCPELDLLLVGNSPNPDGNVDWNETNVVYLQIAYDGVATNPAFNGQLFYKTNADHANSQYWGQLVASVYHTPKVVGTWSVTFGTNGEVELTVPDGTTNSGQFPAEAAAFFNTTVFPYMGIQPYGLHYPTVQYSHFGITGVAVPLDDSFADLSNWNITVASDRVGVALHPVDTVYELTWLGPAAGFSLQQTADLTIPTWVDAVAAGVPTPVLIGDFKKAFIPLSALPSPSSTYWRLMKP
jgi:hypothetical protein